MKAAFPPWLRRIDPLLAAEDSNPVFEAFRLRRKAHQKHPFRSLLKPGRTSYPPSLVAWSILIFLVTIGVFAFCSCMALVIPIIALPLLRQHYYKQRITGDFLPNRMGRVLSSRGFVESPAVDIWMTGATGRDVLEAIYLEERQRQIFMLHIAGAILLVVPPCLYAWLGLPLTLHGILLMVGSIFLIVGAYRYALVSGIEEIRSRKLEDMLGSWRGSGVFGNTFQRAVERMAFLLTAAVLAGAVSLTIFLAVVLIVKSLHKLHRDSQLPAYLMGHGVEFYIAILMITMGLTALFLAGIRRPMNIDQCRDTLDTADFSYNMFMAQTVMRDPEGESWARWRYGHPRQFPGVAPNPLVTSLEDADFRPGGRQWSRTGQPPCLPPETKEPPP